MSQQVSLVCNYDDYIESINLLKNTIYTMIVSIGLLVITCFILAVLYLLEIKKKNDEELEIMNDANDNLTNNKYEYA